MKSRSFARPRRSQRRRATSFTSGSTARADARRRFRRGCAPPSRRWSRRDERRRRGERGAQRASRNRPLEPQRSEPAYNPAAGITACDLRILVEARCRSAALARAPARFGLAHAAAPVLARDGTLRAPLFFAMAMAAARRRVCTRVGMTAPLRFALIPAAGTGMRFGGDVPKQYTPLAGVPLLKQTIDALNDAIVLEAIFVVLAPQDRLYAECIGSVRGVEPLYCGGITRAESVRNGLP